MVRCSRRRLSRYDRTQRLHAAHAVVVVTAYYEPVQLTDSARDATYSLNLIVLALVLRQKVYAPDLRMDYWWREALFWKSRLSSRGDRGVAGPAQAGQSGC